MKNYLEIYKQKPVRKFQAGGAMPVDPGMGDPGMAPEGQQDPEAELEAMIMQVVETGDAELALQVVYMLAETLGIGAAPAGDPGMAPEEGGVPMGRYGMRVPVLSKRLIKR